MRHLDCSGAHDRTNQTPRSPFDDFLRQTRRGRARGRGAGARLRAASKAAATKLGVGDRACTPARVQRAEVQKPYDPLRESAPASQPFDEPTPQRPTLEPPTAQAPIEKPLPQKPFYGPGTTSPEERERAKAKTEKRLTDAEVIGVAVAANDGEVKMAEVAIKKAVAPDVKKFAETMKSDHEKALKKDKALEKKAKIVGADSDASAALKADAEKTLEELRTKNGRAFDRAYMDAQVKAHKDVLASIDNRLIPSAQNGEVKALLVEMRRTVADHLVSAEEIQKKAEQTVTSSRVPRDSRTGPGVVEPKEKLPSEPAGKQQDQSKARTPAPTPLEKP